MTTFTQPNPPFTMSEQYMNTPATYPTKPEPLSDEWSYGNPVDLLNMNPMMPTNSFGGLDMSDDLATNLDTKDFANIDPYTQISDLSGFTIADQPAEDTVSSGSLTSVCIFLYCMYTIE